MNSAGFSPHPDLIKAIRESPVPRNATDVQYFHGLCQQVGHFSTKVAKSLKPLRPSKKKASFGSGEAHDQTFQNARKALSEITDVAFYDVNHPIALRVDASRLYGLGFILKQKDADGNWQMVQAESNICRMWSHVTL